MNKLFEIELRYFTVARCHLYKENDLRSQKKKENSARLLARLDDITDRFRRDISLCPRR